MKLMLAALKVFFAVLLLLFGLLCVGLSICFSSPIGNDSAHITSVLTGLLAGLSFFLSFVLIAMLVRSMMKKDTDDDTHSKP